VEACLKDHGVSCGACLELVIPGDRPNGFSDFLTPEEQELMDNHVKECTSRRIVLSPEQWDVLVDMVENPRPPTPALIELFKKYKK
jgi:hypothetical protein